MINLDFGLHYALFVTRPSGSVICFIEKESIAVQAHKFVNIRNRKYSLSLSLYLYGPYWQDSKPRPTHLFIEEKLCFTKSTLVSRTMMLSIKASKGTYLSKHSFKLDLQK